ncbi:MAG: hypothetical protein ACRCTA_00060, partial [Bacilli bacterium]
MSIKMFLSLALEQGLSNQTMCKDKIAAYEDVQCALKEFINDSPSLSGMAYDSAKEYFASVLLPLTRGGILLSEAVASAVSKFPQEYINQVASVDLDEDYLEEKIEECKKLIEEALYINDIISSSKLFTISKTAMLKANEKLIDHYDDVKRKLEEKLEKLLSFNIASKAIFDEVFLIRESLNTGLSQSDSAWDTNTKTFKKPIDLTWANDINDRWSKYNSPQKTREAYIQTLQEQFGFDKETAILISKLQAEIDRRFPDLSQAERDYIFLRILGGFSYGENP